MKTEKAMRVERNIEALSRKNCYRGKAMIITYSECVGVCSLSYSESKAHAPQYNVISRSTTFSNIKN
jgi:hypothetical protein